MPSQRQARCGIDHCDPPRAASISIHRMKLISNPRSAARSWSARSAINSAFRDRRRIGAVMAVVLLAALVVALLKAPAYTATTSLLVLMSDEYALRPNALSTQATPSLALERDAIMNSELSILMSPGLVKAMLHKVGPQRLYPSSVEGGMLHRLAPSMFEDDAVDPADQVVERFMRDFKAAPDKSGSTIVATFRHTDRDLAAEALNVLVQLYQEKRAEVYANAQSGLIKVEVDKARTDLDKASAELQAYQLQHGISDFGAQMDLLLRRLADLTRAQQAADTDVLESARRVATLTQELEKTPAQVVQYAESDADGRVKVARDSLVDLRRQESELRQTYTEQSQKVTSVRRQIDTMEREVRRLSAAGAPSAVRRGQSEVHSSLQLDLARAHSERESLEQRKRELGLQVADVQRQVNTLQARRADLEALGRQKGLSEQTYMAATKVLQERLVIEGMGSKKAANVRVIEPAESPLKPDRTRLVILAGGVMLSLLCGLLAAVLGERFRRTFIAPERLEAELGLPVLACVSPKAQPLGLSRRMPGHLPGPDGTASAPA
jgi:polysaccharide biosynthesis protein PslE